MLLYCNDRSACGLCSIDSTDAWEFHESLSVEGGQFFLWFFLLHKKCDLLEPDRNLSDEKYLSAAGKCLLYDDYSLYVRGNPAENAKYGCQWPEDAAGMCVLFCIVHECTAFVFQCGMCIAEKGNKGGKDCFYHLDAFYGSISLSVRTWKYYFSGIMFYDAFFPVERFGKQDSAGTVPFFSGRCGRAENLSGSIWASACAGKTI